MGSRSRHTFIVLAALLFDAPLDDAASFVVLAGTSVSNRGRTTITGNVGVTPGNTVTGIAASDFTVGEIFRGGTARRARADADALETALAVQPCTEMLSTLTTRTLAPGVYCFASRDVALTGALLLDARRDRDAVWIFRIAGTLTTAAESSVLVMNGGYGGNVFWQVGGLASLGAASTFTGNLLAQTHVTVGEGASVSGRLFARTGAVTLNDNRISLCCEPIMLSPIALADGAVAATYRQELTAGGGASPYTFRISSGTLPPGLSLSGNAITGTPAEAGRFAFTVTATDRQGCSGTASHEVAIVCPAAMCVSVAIPTLGTWMLMLIAVVLGAVGVAMIRGMHG